MRSWAVAAGCLFFACTSRTEVEAPVVEAADCGALELETSGCAWIDGGAACELGESRELRVWIAGEGDGFRLELSVPAGTDRLAIRSGCKKTVLELPAVRAIHPAIAEADAMRKRGEGEAALARLTAELPKLGDADRGRALGIIARIERSAGRAEIAVQRFQEAIAAHRSRGDVSLEARDRAVLAYALIGQLRRFHEAREVLDDPLFARAPDAEAQIAAAQYRASVFIGTGDSRNALAALEDSERRALRMGLLDLWRDSKQQEGSTLLDVGRAREGVELFEELVRLTPESEDPCLSAALFTNLGWARLIEREQRARPTITSTSALPEAPLQRALSLWRGACPEPAQVQNVLLNLALAAVQEDRWNDARRRLAELPAAELDPERMLWRLELEGRIALAAGKAREALSIYQRLSELATATFSPSGMWRAAVGRGHALELARNVKAAAAAYEDAEAILDRASVLVPLGEGREHFLGGHAESAKAAIGALLRLERYAEAADLARRARVRPLAALQRAHILEGLGSDQRAAWEHAIAAYRSERDELDRQAAQDWRLPQDRLRAAHAAQRAREEHLERTLERALATLATGPQSSALRSPTEENSPSRDAKNQREPAAPNQREPRRAPVEGSRFGALRRPGEGELFLVYHPIEDGYAGFAVTRDRVVGRVLGAELLEPFRAEILRAEVIFVMAAGELRETDVHALPFDGEPLVARVPVLYALDFASSSTATEAATDDRASGRKTAALIVADPEGNLSSAQTEAEASAAALAARGFEVEALLRNDATGTAVRSGLLRARRFYYAGHARFGGLDGWESALPLARRGKLTVADVLALPAIPEHVVLSGCETARSGQRALGDSLGIAHAFLTAGAREVVATSRPIGDRAAAAFSAELLAAENAQPANMQTTNTQPAHTNDARAFAMIVREAQLNLKKRAPELDWQAFRALVR